MTHVPDARSGGRPDGLRARKRSIRWLSAPSLGSNFSVAIVYLLEKVQTSGVSEPEKNRPMAVVHALWTAVFLWVGWFIGGYGTPVFKTMQGLLFGRFSTPKQPSLATKVPAYRQAGQRDFC